MVPVTTKELPLELWLMIFEYLNDRDTVNVCLAINLPLPYCKNKCFTFRPHHAMYQQPVLYDLFSRGKFNNCKICKLKLKYCSLLRRDISNLMTFSQLKDLRLHGVTFTTLFHFSSLATSPLQLNKLELVSCHFFDAGRHNHRPIGDRSYLFPIFNGPIIFEHLKILRISRCIDLTPKTEVLSSISANLDLITIQESKENRFFFKPLLLTAKHFTFDKRVRFPDGFVSNATEVTPLYNTDFNLNLDLFPHVNTVHLASFQHNSSLTKRVNKICIQSIRSLDDINMEDLRSLDQFNGDFVFGGFEYPMLGDLLEISMSSFNRLEYFLLSTRKMKNKNQMTIKINFGMNKSDEVDAISTEVFYGIDTLILNGVHPFKLIGLGLVAIRDNDSFRKELELYKLWKRFPTIRRLIIILTRCNTELNDWYINELVRSEFIRCMFPRISFMCMKRKNKQDISHTYEDNKIL